MDRAGVQLAADGGDDELAAYALVRRAELALYTGDSMATVQLARLAGQQARSARIRDWQGHALVGDRDACRRALDRGAELTSGAAPPDDADPVLGSIHLPDLTAFVAGWCMHDLGSPAEAVTCSGTGWTPFPRNPVGPGPDMAPGWRLRWRTSGKSNRPAQSPNWSPPMLPSSTRRPSAPIFCG
ncbi:hypothetical protein IPZ61_03275 [Streptomyces sioyaensis]|uniref:hypothetical protein n=1 Tax=Streptomyces sioyaensis TaxID=67364 RepID=UPI001F25E766|nr:hypothetical protein [Streptomyces sioyaensis]MCF3172349.1 hypothetical protein [Streptomyces sioyaensis]